MIPFVKGSDVDSSFVISCMNVVWRLKERHTKFVPNRQARPVFFVFTSMHRTHLFFIMELSTYRRLGAKGSYLTLVRVADGII